MIEEKKQPIIKKSLKELIEIFSKDDVIFNIEKNYHKENIKYLSCDEIIDNKFIKTARIDKETIETIEKSIITNGLYNPLIVRESKTLGKYEVIIGRKRWIASKKLNKQEIPVVVKNYTDEEVLLILLCDSRENKNFNPIELALIIEKLNKSFHYKKKDIAEFLHESTSQISNYVALLKMPKEIIYEVSTNKLSFGHARAIARLNEKEMKTVLKKIYQYNLSVRDTEDLVYNMKSKDSFIVKKKYAIRRNDKNTILIKFNNDYDIVEIIDKLENFLSKNVK